MFGFLKKCLDKPINTLQEYYNDVIKRSENNSCERFATFTPQGLNLIIELMIQKSQYNLNMFIEKREIYFDILKLDMLERKLQQFEQSSGKVSIITFGGESDDVFIKLQTKYPKSFQYCPLKCSNASEVNNFIVVDNKSYLIEDPTWNHRVSLKDDVKAEVNFFDYSKTNDLIQRFQSYLNAVKTA
jgi:hypothetical protein